MSHVLVIRTLSLHSCILYCLILPDTTPPYATSLSSLYPTLGLGTLFVFKHWFLAEYRVLVCHYPPFLSV